MTIESCTQCIALIFELPLFVFFYQGFREACEKGPMIGQKLTGVLIRLQDGMHHMVDSSDLAFRLAAIGALKEGRY